MRFLRLISLLFCHLFLIFILPYLSSANSIFFVVEYSLVTLLSSTPLFFFFFFSFKYFFNLLLPAYLQWKYQTAYLRRDNIVSLIIMNLIIVILIISIFCLFLFMCRWLECSSELPGFETKIKHRPVLFFTAFLSYFSYFFCRHKLSLLRRSPSFSLFFSETCHTQKW